jgi:2-amino-4-hydroxy-6-hydroxymethyldihydropteridine diphosphokinase
MVVHQQSLEPLTRQMHTNAVTAYIALGANLGDAASTVQSAIGKLGSIAHTRLVRASSLYQTAPIDSAGPDYINAVAEVLTELPAPLLLEQLQMQEQAAGRQRPYANAPRTLDLDLLLYGCATVQSPALTLPHPRMGQRAFVLQPLAEIAPQWVTAAELQSVSAQAIRKM